MKTEAEIRSRQAWAEKKRNRQRCISLFGETCFYCQKAVTGWDLTLDHLIPRSAGGRDIGNVVPACQSCNNAKGDNLPSPEQVDRATAVYAKWATRNRSKLRR